MRENDDHRIINWATYCGDTVIIMRSRDECLRFATDRSSSQGHERCARRRFAVFGVRRAALLAKGNRARVRELSAQPAVSAYYPPVRCGISNAEPWCYAAGASGDDPVRVRRRLDVHSRSDR